MRVQSSFWVWSNFKFFYQHSLLNELHHRRQARPKTEHVLPFDLKNKTLFTMPSPRTPNTHYHHLTPLPQTPTLLHHHRQARPKTEHVFPFDSKGNKNKFICPLDRLWTLDNAKGFTTWTVGHSSSGDVEEVNTVK